MVFDGPVTNAMVSKFHFPYNKKKIKLSNVPGTAWDKFLISDLFSIFISFTDNFKT